MRNVVLTAASAAASAAPGRGRPRSAEVGPARPRLLKARHAADCLVLEQLPNVGPSLAGDLRLLGISTPDALRTADGFQLYQRLCAATGQRQDPCVLDTFLAITDFMRGAAPAPWWHYTAARKQRYPGV